MAELNVYRFPARPAVGVLFGLSLPRLVTYGAAGVVLIVVSARPTLGGMVAGGLLMLALVAVAAVKVAGRALVDWLPVAAAYVWRQVTRSNEFYASPDLVETALPEGVLDLPGELFGLELHAYLAADARATINNPTAADYGILIDTFRGRLVAVYARGCAWRYAARSRSFDTCV